MNSPLFFHGFSLFALFSSRRRLPTGRPRSSPGRPEMIPTGGDQLKGVTDQEREGVEEIMAPIKEENGHESGRK